MHFCQGAVGLLHSAMITIHADVYGFKQYHIIEDPYRVPVELVYIMASLSDNFLVLIQFPRRAELGDTTNTIKVKWEHIGRRIENYSLTRLSLWSEHIGKQWDVLLPKYVCIPRP